MNTPSSTEVKDTLAEFPPALRALIDAELAAGNSVVEIGHSFPAPPAGAYVRLARKVSTRPRASDAELDWRGRNSSLSSGEFTDTRRFHFVVEPPDPPPPEPDMDALRQAINRPSVVDREPASPARTQPRMPPPRRPRVRVSAARGPLTVREMAGGVAFELAVRDARPPVAMWALLEAVVGVPFTPAMVDSRFELAATANMSGAPYTLVLRYDTAAARTNRYTFLVTGSWSHFDEGHHAHFRRQADGWLSLWSRAWPYARWTPPGPNVAGAWHRRAHAALREAQRLAHVDTLHAEIIAGLRHGGWYTWSDKEGTTRIAWNGHAFTRRGEGDHVAHEAFTDEAALLRLLRAMCGMSMSLHGAAPDLAEADAWRVVLHMMQWPG